MSWVAVSQSAADTPNQVAQSDDYEALRNQTNVYRARTVGTKTNQEVLSSAWSGDAAAFAINDGTWWIKAIGAPGSNIGGVNVRGPVQFSRNQSVGVFQPLGRAESVVVSGDIYGRIGEYVLLFSTDAEWVAAQGVLFTHTGDVVIQDPFNEQSIVRFVSRSVEHLGTAGRPLRAVTVGYVEVG